jgi:hypothetical protein
LRLATRSEWRWCTRDAPPASALHVLRRLRCAAHALVLRPVQLLVGRTAVPGLFAAAALLPPALGAAGPRAQLPSHPAIAGRCKRRGQVGCSGRRSLRTQRYGLRVAATWCTRVARRSPPRLPSRGRRPHVALERWRTTHRLVRLPVAVLALRRAVPDSAAAATFVKPPLQACFAVPAVGRAALESKRTPAPRASAIFNLPRHAH